MILTWPEGDRNVEAVVESTMEGIEIEWIGTIPWEWVLKAINYQLAITESIRGAFPEKENK